MSVLQYCCLVHYNLVALQFYLFASDCESKEWSMSTAMHLNEDVDHSPVTLEQ